MMEKITVYTGEVVALSNGATQDLRRPVRFVGEGLAELTTYGYSDRTGYPTDTRGVTETLYRTEDGRLVVYVQEWSRWQGEPNYYRLVEVTEADLQVGGRFEDLGREAGFGRALTLEEALEAA